MKARYFNTFVIDKDILTKKSEHSLLSEFRWLDSFKNSHIGQMIPDKLKQISEYEYRMKYYKDYELLFFKDVDFQIKTLEKIMRDFDLVKINIESNLHKLAYDKVLERTKDLDKSITDKYFDIYKYLFKDHKGEIGVFHGDLHSSNILVKNNDIKLIDPRGTLYGDLYYDLAKFFHGIYYGYVINDIDYDFVKILDFEKAFKEYCIKSGYVFNKIVLLTAGLFISMLPLHKNEIHKEKFLNLYEYLIYKLKNNEFK